MQTSTIVHTERKRILEPVVAHSHAHATRSQCPQLLSKCPPRRRQHSRRNCLTTHLRFVVFPHQPLCHSHRHVAQASGIIPHLRSRHQRGDCHRPNTSHQAAVVTRGTSSRPTKRTHISPGRANPHQASRTDEMAGAAPWTGAHRGADEGGTPTAERQREATLQRVAVP